MSLKTLTYVVEARIPPRDARDRVAALLVAERVRYVVTDQNVRSTKTPLGLNFQSLWFTQRNWVGLNPFAHVSGVAFDCAGAATGPTRVTVRVDRTRALYMVSPYLSAYLLAPLVPVSAAILVSIGATGLIWFILSYVAGHLLRSEVRDALDVGAA